ncbi:MAG: hypothetical protein ACTSXJ_02515 [Candidatus Baldrarchaeia archaeon]
MSNANAIRSAVEREILRRMSLRKGALRKRVLDAIMEELDTFISGIIDIIVKTLINAITSAAKEATKEVNLQQSVFSAAYAEDVLKLQTELNKLYNLTEEDPKYQVYWMLRDFRPSWVRVEYISKTLGIPLDAVRSYLLIFARKGLVEVRGNEARIPG